MKITIDFRLIEIDYELWALGEYLNILEQQLPSLREQYRLQIYAQLQEQHFKIDDAELDIELQELRELVDRVLPRFILTPYLVSLWIAYESGVIEIANHLKARQQQILDMQDIRGGSFLDRAREYFDHVLEFSLCADNQVWQRLKMIMVLRNAIAHSNGRIAAMNKNTREKIKNWEEENMGISTLDGKLVLSGAFLRDAYKIIDESLHDLLKRVRSKT